MRARQMFRMVMLLAMTLLFGCGEGSGGGSPSSGAGGATGTTSTTATVTATVTSSSGSGTTSGGVDGVLGHPSDVTVQDAQKGEVVCAAVGPLPNEDGAFVRKTFLATEPGVIQRATFVGLASMTLGYTAAKPWTVGLSVVAAGTDPATVSCASISNPEDLEEVVTWAQDNGDVASLWQWNAQGSFATGDTLVACLRMYTDADGMGHDTAIFQCGGPGSCDDSDQWQANAGAGETILEMSSYGPTYCQWWTIDVRAKFIAAPQ